MPHTLAPHQSSRHWRPQPPASAPHPSSRRCWRASALSACVIPAQVNQYASAPLSCTSMRPYAPTCMRQHRCAVCAHDPCSCISAVCVRDPYSGKPVCVSTASCPSRFSEPLPPFPSSPSSPPPLASSPTSTHLDLTTHSTHHPILSCRSTFTSRATELAAAKTSTSAAVSWLPASQQVAHRYHHSLALMVLLVRRLPLLFRLLSLLFQLRLELSSLLLQLPIQSLDAHSASPILACCTAAHSISAGQEGRPRTRVSLPPGTTQARHLLAKGEGGERMRTGVGAV